MVVRTQTRAARASCARGVMELYISDHPLDCLTCAPTATANCRRQAGVVGLREVRYGYDGANHIARRRRTTPTPISLSNPSKCIVCSRCVRACEEVQGTFALTILGAASTRKVSPGGDRFPDSRMRLLRRLRAGLPDRDAEREERDRARASRSVRSSPPAPIAASAARSRRRCKGEKVVRMVPYKAGKANEGHSCVKGRFAYGYATHKDRITKPMIRAKITDPWREVSWDEAIAYAAAEFKRIQAKYGRDSDRRHHLLALHQRGSVPDPEAGARRLRQQQRRHLRPRLPFADRLWPQPDLRHLGRHAGFQVGRRKPTSSWSSAPIPPTRIRCSPRA